VELLLLRFLLAPRTGARYTAFVRVIARRTLIDFVKNRLARRYQALVKTHLDAWYEGVTKATWKNSAELKAQYGSASILSAERVVFNIKGNDYRLIVSINYDYRLVRIKWLGTHKEYDNIDAREVQYDKERYTSSSDSN
jgi:mRNA interferase HigB